MKNCSAYLIKAAPDPGRQRSALPGSGAARCCRQAGSTCTRHSYVSTLVGLICAASLSACQELPSAEEPQGERQVSVSDTSIEPVSGLPKSGLLAIQRIQVLDEEIIGVLYTYGTIPVTELKKSAPRLCAHFGSKVETSYDTELEHPGQMPAGTRKYIIKCK